MTKENGLCNNEYKILGLITNIGRTSIGVDIIGQTTRLLVMYNHDFYNWQPSLFNSEMKALVVMY